MSKKFLVPALLAILLVALGYSLTKKNQAPDVMFTTISGQQIRMDQLRGQMVLINFWATTCPGCIAEMPGLVETYKRYHPQGFELIAVAMSYDAPDQVANYTRTHALPFPVAYDVQGDLAYAFDDVKLTPTSVLVDQHGRIVRRIVGELDFTALNQVLDQSLGRPI